MHPKIIRLYIHNYRCFVNFELRPEGRILLLGYNGAGKSSIFHVLAALQDLSVWNKDASEAFPRGTLTAFGGSSEQRFEIDVASQWGVFRYMLHLVHDEKRDDDVFLARDASNFGAWCRNLLAEAPDAAQRAREVLEEVIPGFESIRAQSVGRGKVLVVKLSQPGGPGHEIDFDALSDGQKVLIVLYMVLHAVAPRARMLCLDEPDNFVSIREIQPFLVDLARIGDDTGVQPLLISHSAEVIDFIGAEEAILIERPGGALPRVGSLSPDKSLRLSQQMARGWQVTA